MHNIEFYLMHICNQLNRVIRISLMLLHKYYKIMTSIVRFHQMKSNTYMSFSLALSL